MKIISRYREDVSWIKDYDFDYIIYNKGAELVGYNTINIENTGNNQRDIFHYIYSNYDILPDVMTFIQGNPFDHCKKKKFDETINNIAFTALESFEDLINITNSSQKIDADGGYMERNDSWYISAHNRTYNQTCKWNSFDDFMNDTFVNYIPQDWNRFTPGSQYIITKEIANHYSREFWLYLMNILNANNMTEGHIIERSLWMIFQCKLEAIC
jgi:hypothetical protein